MPIKVDKTGTIKIIAIIGNQIGEVTHHQDQFATDPILNILSVKNERNRIIGNPVDFDLFILFFNYDIKIIIIFIMVKF